MSATTKTKAWDDERIARMARLWADGYSAEDIACALGNTTRNAVLGKIHRLGIQHTAGERTSTRNQFHRPTLFRPTKASSEVAKRAKYFTASKAAAVNRMKNAAARIQATVPAEPPLPVEAPPPPGRVGLLDLQPHHCKFPYSDPRRDDFGFCGADRIEGRSYCAKHTALCYVKASNLRPVGLPRKIMGKAA